MEEPPLVGVFFVTPWTVIRKMSPLISLIRDCSSQHVSAEFRALSSCQVCHPCLSEVRVTVSVWSFHLWLIAFLCISSFCAVISDDNSVDATCLFLFSRLIRETLSGLVAPEQIKKKVWVGGLVCTVNSVVLDEICIFPSDSQWRPDLSSYRCL